MRTGFGDAPMTGVDVLPAEEFSTFPGPRVSFLGHVKECVLRSCVLGVVRRTTGNGLLSALLHRPMETTATVRMPFRVKCGALYILDGKVHPETL